MTSLKRAVLNLASVLGVLLAGSFLATLRRIPRPRKTNANAKQVGDPTCPQIRQQGTCMSAQGSTGPTTVFLRDRQ